MRIVIDARMYGGFGIGRYTRNLIEHLQKIDSKNQYFILHLKGDFEQFKYRENFKKVEANFHWYGFSEQLRLPVILNKLKPDLVHFPHFNVPIFYNGLYVVTVHDLIHQHFQMKRATTHGAIVYEIKKKAYNLAFSRALKKSKKILTVSEYVKKDLVNEWRVNSDKIEITPEAVDENILSLLSRIDQKETKKVLEKFKINQPFIYYVGTAHPHKNIEGLIKAFLLLRRRYQYLSLVLSGSKNYFWDRVIGEYKSKDIIYTGFVDDMEMVSLMKGAKLYIQPSFEEGFGIPLLEAMACGCPVVSSNKASLPEVGGDACLYFDPFNTDDIVDKITDCLNNESLRKVLIERGYKRQKGFSWEKLAKQTLNVYLDVIS